MTSKSDVGAGPTAAASPTIGVPSTSTFSFKAPFPPNPTSLKQRRASLAQASAPRLVPVWSFRDDTELAVASTSELGPEKRGKMRKIATDDGEHELSEPVNAEKKQRKKWTAEETQQLVDGCNIWGVGNWKAILKDPKFKFDNRSPVDLKDRFRTYFPDAYKQHYPNAKTHLSSKVRSTLPDGRSLFEKTRSKKRRPFTEEEDRALKSGYEKHGTVWATIVKDPVFQDQNRRSTDLRDRFRNAFPDLYQAAGYKPRNAPKKKKREDGSWIPTRAATDDQLPTSTSTIGAVPIPRRRRAQTTSGMFRGGTKSVPDSATCSEDEESSAGEDDIAVDRATPQPEDPLATCQPFSPMDMLTMDQLSEPVTIPDFTPSSSQSMSEMSDWGSHMDGSDSNTWAPAVESAGSPASSHISSSAGDYFPNRRDGVDMIGKSAWGTQDWFSANPRLDASGVSSSSSSYVGGLSPAPSSPFSFQNLNHGVVDRYDLFPSTMPHDFASSEVGMGDTHSTFSDPEMFPPSSFRGFTHHSNYAGDLIFGARSHQPQQSWTASSWASFDPVAHSGALGLQQSAGIHPMQLHTAAMPGIDEIPLASITLNDRVEPSHDAMHGTTNGGVQKGESDLHLYHLDTQGLDHIVDLSQELHITPPATPLTRGHREDMHQGSSSHHSRSYSVPPGEFRNPNPNRPPQIHTNSQPQLTRAQHSDPSLVHFDGTGQSAFQISQNNFTNFSYSDSWAPNDRDLPFLDLHYYGNNSAGPFYDGAESKYDSDHTRQGQALDLAQSASSLSRAYMSTAAASPPPPPPPPPPMMMHPPTSFQMNQDMFNEHARPHSNHQRRQSAVSPEDLQARKGSDNKRKRASWDGNAS
ncbi:hypothetical protein FIBSPDRAFT_817841 [Athelia psychrophila]|uniref:Myb-like domain-containing protein n=1 Tax=Athelia psychrophila TaxID=1759441 RepID=A0A166R3Q5_9AGAM|nr:hypothetical protein FIBSPDRAFT_817841 [Fibularhizoctonia sp. CBS 109695]